MKTPKLHLGIMLSFHYAIGRGMTFGYIIEEGYHFYRVYWEDEAYPGYIGTKWSKSDLRNAIKREGDVKAYPVIQLLL